MTVSRSKPAAKSANRFPQATLERIHKDRILGIQAGKETTHRTIGLWAVVVDGRVFVRSWSMKPRSWWRTLLEDPYATIFVSRRKRGIPVRARPVRSETLKDRVTEAYKEKYNTPGSIGYVQDMARKPSRDTTTELVPL
ncbi:MAG: DUF2255 family protein [Chloroflexota bacterium]|nr:DUF2255 family protein [Chloroflexota bacterium]